MESIIYHRHLQMPHNLGQEFYKRMISKNKLDSCHLPSLYGVVQTRFQLLAIIDRRHILLKTGSCLQVPTICRHRALGKHDQISQEEIAGDRKPPCPWQS